MDFVRNTSASQQNKNATQLKAMFNLTQKDGVPGSELFVESYSGLQPTIRKGYSRRKNLGDLIGKNKGECLYGIRTYL
jgi:hypothetical protein